MNKNNNCDCGYDSDEQLHVAIDLDDTLIRSVSRNGSWMLNDGVSTYLGRIQEEFNCKFSLITARPTDSYNTVKDIIKQIESQLGVRFSNIVCTNFNPKGAYCSELGCSILIDDSEEFLSDCPWQTPRVTSLLLGSSSNKEENRRGHIPCFSWREVYQYFKNNYDN